MSFIHLLLLTHLSLVSVLAKRQFASVPGEKSALEEDLGCAVLCVNADLDEAKSLPGDGNHTWECKNIADYLLTKADRSDCTQLVDHFAPLCCRSQMAEEPSNTTDCSECGGGCIVHGVCFHSVQGGHRFCAEHHGKWCGAAEVSEAEVDRDVAGSEDAADMVEEEDEEVAAADQEAALVQGNASQSATWSCCQGGDFVHTSDSCRSGHVLMLATHHNWLPNGWSDQRWGGSEGTGSVNWQCHSRRRRCGWFGCGGTGHERTGFSPPSNAAWVHYNSQQIDFYPRYCPPSSATVEDSPADRGCCSIADGTVDRCSGQNFIQMNVNGVWKRCYKGQICEWEFDAPQSQGVRGDWYCGHTKEGVRWGLYYDTLQVKFHCNGMVEWNPWWCARATGGKTPPAVVTQFAGLIGMTTGGDYINGKTGQPMSTDQVWKETDEFVKHNKAAICEGINSMAVYDQLLKPSSVCWRAGMQ